MPACGAEVAVEPAPPQCETVTLGTDTLFDFDRYNLKPTGRARLTQLASDINRAEKVTKIKIVGNTDSKGTEHITTSLGQRRADTVAAFLAEKGVPRRQDGRQQRWRIPIRSRPTPCPTAGITRKAAR